MTAAEFLAEYRSWLAEQPDTPAKRWCLENPPGARDMLRVVRRVEACGFRLSRVTLAA